MEGTPHPVENPFVQTLEKNIANAASLTELQAAVARYYDGGGVIAGGGGVYKKDDILARLEPGVAPERVTRTHGLRRRFSELEAERQSREQYEQKKEAADQWISENLQREFSQIESWEVFKAGCQWLIDFLDAEEHRRGHDYSAYKRRAAEWIEEANRLQGVMREEQGVVFKISAMQEIVAYIRSE